MSGIQDHNGIRLEHDRGEIKRLVLVPGKSQTCGHVLFLIEHCTIFQVPQVELPYGAVAAGGSEDAHPVRESDIVGRLVVGDHVCDGRFLLNVPDGAGGVHTGGADHVGTVAVPVEARDGRRVLLLVVGEQVGLQGQFGVVGPEPQGVTAGGQQARGLVWTPHQLGGGVGQFRLGGQVQRFRLLV